MDDLKQQHDEATAPKSDDQLAHDLSMSGTDEQLSEATRAVLVKVLAVHGVNHDTLNISRSKFDKMSKPDLIKALRNKRELTQEKQKEAITPNPSQGIDIFGAIQEVKDEAIKAHKSGDYSKLDSSIADKVLTAANSENGGEGLPFDPSIVSKAVIVLGVGYFAARFIGFDVIANKVNSIRGKAPATKVQDEQSDDQGD